jgi:arylsulfatase A
MFLRSLAFALILPVCGTAFAAETPNFLIMLADDLGYGDLQCYGHPRIQTPHLNKFATEGTRFTQCYSACSVCSPSRSAILTGRTPYRNGVFRWIPENHECHLRTSEVTITSLLKKKGYDTCHAGKWHLNGFFNDPRQPQPNDHGFDHWFATQNNAAPNHINPTNFARNGKAVGPLEGPSSHLVADEIITWLKKRTDKTRPFYVSMWTHEPHLPIETLPQYQEAYADLEPDVRQHHGNVTQMDAAVGKMLAALDELGLRENTFVFFTADNGPEGDGLKNRTRGSTGGLRGRKRDTYEGGIRVPGIWRWPGHVQAGATSNEPIVGTDLFTTVCDITGVPVPTDRTIDGASWLPLLKGEHVVRKQPLYWRNHLAPLKTRVGLRDGDWKILGSNDLTQFELYNLKDDPHETTELSEKHPEKFAEMKKKLADHDRKVLAEGPDWWQRDTADQPKKKKKGQ